MFVGMVCAFEYRHFAKAMQTSKIFRVVSVITAIVVLSFWFTSMYWLPKVQYNALHPYFGFVRVALTPRIKLYLISHVPIHVKYFRCLLNNVCSYIHIYLCAYMFVT